MSNYLFLLGAGFNKDITDFDSINPPLSNDFFNIILNMREFNNEHTKQKLIPLFELIQKVWHKSEIDLQSHQLNLEEVYTYLQLKSLEPKLNPQFYINIRELLTRAMSSCLKSFEIPCMRNPIYRNFGNILYHKKPTIITFNYDCIIERLIESASMPKRDIPTKFLHDFKINEVIPDENILYSHFKWKRPMHYGFEFDMLNLYQAGPSQCIEGKSFYSLNGNTLSDWKILKLHGSLNWFQLTNILRYPTLENELYKFYNENKNKIFLLEENWWNLEPPDFNNWILQPLIITPVLYKNKDLESFPFNDLWRYAYEELLNCNKLVTVGYSFSSTDFNTKMLFLDAFSENSLDELIIVNPDPKIPKKVQTLTNFNKKPIICDNLTELNNIF